MSQEWDKEAARVYWKNKNRALKGKPAIQPLKHHVSDDSEVNTGLALAAIAACPSWAHASTLLKEQHGVICSPAKLRVVAKLHPDELEEMRRKIAPKIEAASGSSMLSNAWLCTEVEGLAMEQTQERLEAGQIAEPWQVARFAADVKAKNVDKRALLEGKPTSITVDKTPAEIFRALKAINPNLVVESTAEEDEPAQLAAGEDA